MALRHTKENLQGYKKIKVNGFKFTIRKLNPLLDFASDKMPQIFTSYYSRRKAEPIIDPVKIQDQMMDIVEAGVVEPELSNRKSKEGITVKDIFRDQETGVRLYWEILSHSLYRFRGLKKVFFWIRLRYAMYMLLRLNTERPLMKLFSIPTS